jgi:hypothetical protein
MAGPIAAKKSVYILPKDIVEMEVPAALSTNYLALTALSGRHRKVAHILGQLLEIRTCDRVKQ